MLLAYLELFQRQKSELTETFKKSTVATAEISLYHEQRDSDTTFKVKMSRVNLQGAAGHIVPASRTACYLVTFGGSLLYTIIYSSGHLTLKL